jgi:CHAD domain-containing protein
MGVQPPNSDRAYRLRREEGLGEGLTRIAAGRAAAARERLEGRAADDPGLADAVHGARKDLKKLRTVVRLLREELGERRYRDESRRFRDAGRALSASRDAEVRLKTLAALIEGGAELPPAAFAWRLALERDRARAKGAGGAAAIAEAVSLIGREGVDSWRLRAGGWGMIAPGVRRLYADGRLAMLHAEEEWAPESFHQWRKRSKDLWYVLRLLAPAWPQALEPAAEEAHRLSDVLGDHHDLALLREDLDERRYGAETNSALAAAIAARQDELASEAFPLGHRIYAERPKQFRRRLREYWRAWRG